MTELAHDFDGAELFTAQSYRFPGPVAERFFYDRSFISFLQGPYGSGKTTVCFFKLLARAFAMPICLDRRRRYRALVLRDTYRRMERTAIRSWHKWFPPSVGHWEGGQDRPSKHRIELEGLDQVVLEFEVEFAAVGDLDIEDFFGGYEITDLFLNEANLQSQEVLTYGAGRCGRYPSMKDLPPGSTFDYGVIGDLNAPEFDSWLLEMQFGELSPDVAALGKTEFFCQPGGRSPGAENIQNLPPHYYARLAAANAHQPWWVARMIDNKPGYSRSGKPVYEEYNDDLHASKAPLPILLGIPLDVGLDAGLHPAAVVGQWLPNGQFYIVKEFSPGHCGPSRFGKMLRLWKDQNAPDHRWGRAWADPTAFDGVDKESGELSWVEIVQNETGLVIEPAPSNEPSVRQDAVRQTLTYMIDGDKPGMLISSDCKDLRKGYASHYRFSKVRSDTGDGYTEKPTKNHWSHVHDANQYLCLGARGRDAVVKDRQGQRPSASSSAGCTVGNTNFSVWGRS